MMPPIVWHPAYATPLGHARGFPMSKYGALRALLVARGLLDGAPPPQEPVAAGLPALARVHDRAYVGRVVAGALTPFEARRIGLPPDTALVERARLAAGGTLLAAHLALAGGLAMNLAGGSHHAGPEGGAGYCIFNDVAVAAAALLDAGRVRRVLVVDLDVHQGDGTARIFADDPRVFTLSVHAERNFPARKARSDLDVGLADLTGDEAYLAAVSGALATVLSRFAPDLAFYNAGVDPAAGDRLGRLALSRAGLLARDRLVLARLRAAGVPVATVLGGGYGTDPEEVASRHLLLFEAAAALAEPGLCG
jgi:acetoin utilization deacetylase AcuC-like enzyme